MAYISNLNKACPPRITQGDTPLWIWAHPVYPSSDGWVAKLYLSSQAEAPQVFTAVADADGISFDFNLTSTFTSLLVPGRNHYTVQLTSTTGTPSAANGAEVVSDTYGETWVKPNPTASVDRRTFNEKCLSQCMAAIQARLAGTVMDEYTIGTTHLKMPSLEKLQELKAFYSAEVKRERGAKNQRCLPVRIRSSRGGIVPFGFNKWFE